MAATPVEPAPPAAPRRGRPRDARADDAILRAALDVLGESGFAGLSMEVVATRAGVGKATIYRRWTSREQLILHALRTVLSPIETVDTGSLRGDLDAFMSTVVALFAASRATDVIPQLIGAACYDPQVRESLDEYVSYRQQPLREILERGLARGELTSADDVDVLVDVLMGPMYYRRLLTGEEFDEPYATRLLDQVIGSTPVPRRRSR